MSNEDLGGGGRGRLASWLLGFVFILALTFGGAFYLPLQNAHHQLIDEYRALAQTSGEVSKKLAGQGKALASAETELAGLRQEASKEQSRNEASRSRVARLKSDLSARLQSELAKGRVALSDRGDTLLVSFPAANAFVDSDDPALAKSTVTALCNVAVTLRRGAEHATLVVPASSSGGDAKTFEEQWNRAAERGVRAAQVMQGPCRYPADRLTVATRSSVSEGAGLELEIAPEPANPKK